MSDFSGSAPSVLLPSASISLFVKDEDIRNAAISLREDWRFARVTIDVIDGDVESAIAHYENNPSPDLVMVETLQISEGFAGRLEVLGGHCAETTAAVVIGPVNDVYLYRKLIEMGVSDYLVKPLSKDVLAGVFAKILIERLGAENSKLVACIGAKGGVGSSSLSYILADVIGNQMNQKTIILDACGGWSYLSVAMGGESVTTLHEVARAAVSTDKDSFNRMIVNVGEKLSFLGTGAESLLDDSVSPENFEIIINKLMQTFPVVIVDLSAADAGICRTVLSRANHVLITSTPTLASLRSARGLLQEVKTLRGDKNDGLHIVVNKRGESTGYEVSDADMAIALKMKPDMNIPLMHKVFAASEGQGKHVSAVSGGEDVLKVVRNFVESKLGLSIDKSQAASTPSQKQNLLGGFLDKIKKK